MYPLFTAIKIRISDMFVFYCVVSIGSGSFYEVGGLATDDQLLVHA